MAFQLPKTVGYTMGDVVVPVIAKDPPKSYHTRKYEPINVGDITYMIRSQEQDRLVENINQYSRGHDPMARPGNKQVNNTMTFIDGETLPQVKYTASNISKEFRPNIRLEDNYALSRMPWRFSKDMDCNVKVEVLPQREEEVRPEIGKLKGKVTNSFQCGNLKSEYTHNADQIHLTEFSGNIIDDPILAYVSTECVKPISSLPEIINMEAIRNRMKELQSISTYAPKSAVLRGDVYEDVACHGYVSWKDNKHVDVGYTAPVKGYSNGDNRTNIDGMTRENLEVGVQGKVYNPRNGQGSNNKGDFDENIFIQDILNIQGVTSGKTFTNAGSNDDRQPVRINTRGKELISSGDVENRPVGIIGTTQNVINRARDIPVDLSGVTKMSL